MTVVHIPTHGLPINGVVYRASGAGLHATIVICHGLPGNEKNLDLAQAARRASWNAVTFNYRGSWGSPGNFRFAQNPEDAAAVLEYLRTPSNAAALGIDSDGNDGIEGLRRGHSDLGRGHRQAKEKAGATGRNDGRRYGISSWCHATEHGG
jgi:hypothetical protein